MLFLKVLQKTPIKFIQMQFDFFICEHFNEYTSKRVLRTCLHRVKVFRGDKCKMQPVSCQRGRVEL